MPAHSEGRFFVRSNGASNYRHEVMCETPKGKEIVLARIVTPKGKPDEAAANAKLLANSKDLAEQLEEALFILRAIWQAKAIPGGLGILDCIDSSRATLHAAGREVE